MKLYVLFHHPDDDSSLMPNAIAVTDEYTIDTAGEEYWYEEKAQVTDSMGPGSTREVIINVNDSQILDLFKVSEVRGQILGGS